MKLEAFLIRSLGSIFNTYQCPMMRGMKGMDEKLDDVHKEHKEQK